MILKKRVGEQMDMQDAVEDIQGGWDKLIAEDQSLWWTY